MKFSLARFLPAFLIFISPTLWAADLVVSNANDSGAGSLRKAIADALATPEPDTITFDDALTGDLEIVVVSGPFLISSGDRITIDGEAGFSSVTITGYSANRLFEIADGADLELIGLTLADGQAPHGTEGVDGVTGSVGMDGGHGGAIYNQGRLLLTRCLLKENMAGNGGDGGNKTGSDPGVSGAGGRGGFGGAIYSIGATASVQLEEIILDRNKAGDGGAAGNRPDGISGTVGLAGKGGSGGAVYVAGGELKINLATLKNNRAGRGGFGGISVGDGPSGQGGSGGDGGAIAFDESEFTMTDSTLVDNEAGAGVKGGDEVDGSDFHGDGGHGGNGGAIWGFHFPASATPQISGCYIGSNDAGRGANGGSIPALGETWLGSEGGKGGNGGSGGGLFLVGNPVDEPVWTMTNTTIHFNFAGDGGFGGDGSNAGIGGTGGTGGDAGNGGGIAFSSDGGDYTALLSHVTVYVNNAGDEGLPGSPAGGGLGAPSSGGGIWEFPGGISNGPGVTLANTVVASNDASAIQNIAPGFLAEGINFTSGIPQLLDLSNNGGPTETLALERGSPLIDGGGILMTPLLMDQRGVARPFNNKPDIGAYESELVPEVEPPSTALRQPDLRIGTSSNPAAHRGDNFYTSSGAGQLLPVKLKTAKAAKFFLSLQNDGRVADNLTLSGSPANKTLKLTALSLTGGTVNVTAQLRLGFQVADLSPGQTALFQVSVKARSKKKAARQQLSYTARSSDATQVDTVLAKVTQKKGAKKKK